MQPGTHIVTCKWRLYKRWIGRVQLLLQNLLKQAEASLWLLLCALQQGMSVCQRQQVDKMSSCWHACT